VLLVVRTLMALVLQATVAEGECVRRDVCLTYGGRPRCCAQPISGSDLPLEMEQVINNV
jgi:hypothetical protein